ncbi:unnamed protein product [Paramecium sonneborni]|uniref:Tc1-like transposase DDE domain-containing protein n=1 Tax=Paramecium sonneborni TaxID=65129 RepID=A0A8S1NCL5_9CILI|nr:unnamed protein product [Paramecium sonneborni]
MIQKSDDSDSDYSPKKPFLYKQKALKSNKIENRETFYECQPLLTKHQVCDSTCLTFKKQIYQNQHIRNRIKKIEPLPLYNCQIYLQNILNSRAHKKLVQKKQKKPSNWKKNVILRCQNLNQTQRMQIEQLQAQGYRNCIIAALLGVSPQQVRRNQFNINLNQSREQIQLTNIEKTWLKFQAQQQSNSVLFNAFSFRNAFLNKFPDQTLSIQQFRKILHQQQIRYRTPSLKPLTFFQKEGKNEETVQFISTLCGYLNENYSIIFIDECSLGNISKYTHKQWHVLGSFKQTTHRISTFKYLISALGTKGFLYFQLFEGTGKAYIFQDFVTSIVYKAQEFYKSQKFVFVMDNCSIHKSSQMKKIFVQTHCIFTPAYRPEFNAIEHMFGWISRRLVISQPNITTQYIYQIHRIMNDIDDKMIDEWCCSIFKPLLREIKFIE